MTNDRHNEPLFSAEDYASAQPIVLSGQDAAFFFDMIDNPPPPNDKLKALMSSAAPWAQPAGEQ